VPPRLATLMTSDTVIVAAQDAFHEGATAHPTSPSVHPG
jgi:hypothetical protein